MAKNRKKKRTKSNMQKQLSPKQYIKQYGRSLEIYKCFVTDGWQEHGVLNVLVVRKHKSGNYTFAHYLVDITCLGVKDVYFDFNLSEEEYQELISRSTDSIEVEYALVHNLIYEAIAYAEDYGLFPHKDFGIAKYLLEEDDDAIEKIDVKVGGKNGKPLLVESNLIKFEKARKILDRTAGPGNYDYILGDEGGFDDDDEFDEFDDEFEDEFEDEFDEFDDEFDDVFNKKVLQDIYFVMSYSVMYLQINNEEFNPNELTYNSRKTKRTKKVKFNSELIDLVDDFDNAFNFDDDEDALESAVQELLEFEDKSIETQEFVFDSISYYDQIPDNYIADFYKRYPDSPIAICFMAMKERKSEYSLLDFGMLKSRLEDMLLKKQTYKHLCYIYSSLAIIAIVDNDIFLADNYNNISFEIAEKYEDEHLIYGEILVLINVLKTAEVSLYRRSLNEDELDEFESLVENFIDEVMQQVAFDQK